MRSDIGNVHRRSDIRIEAGRWLNVGGGNDFLLPVVRINIIDSHGNVVARSDVPLRPNVEVAEWRHTFERQTGYRVVYVGYTVVVAVSLSGNVPSEEVVSNPR